MADMAPHECDEYCVCLFCQKPLVYVRLADLHACFDDDCETRVPPRECILCSCPVGLRMGIAGLVCTDRDQCERNCELREQAGWPNPMLVVRVQPDFGEG